MKKNIVKNLVVFSLILFSFNMIFSTPTAQSSTTLYDTKVTITKISVYDKFSSGTYDVEVGILWSRIYGDFGHDYSKDESYDDGLNNNDADLYAYSDWEFKGGTLASKTYTKALSTCYSKAPGSSGYELKLQVMVDKHGVFHGHLDQRASLSYSSSDIGKTLTKNFWYGGYGGGLTVSYKISAV